MIQDTLNEGGAHVPSQRDFSAILSRHEPMLVSLANEAQQAPFSVEEMFCECTFGLWQASIEFRGDPVVEEGEFRKFARVVIKNHLNRIKRDFFRRGRAHKRLTDAHPDLDDEMGHEQLDWHISDGLDLGEYHHELPSYRLELNDVREMIGLALFKLPHRQQTVLKLRYLAGLDLKSVGRFIGISANAVGVYERRGLDAMRSLLNASTETANQRYNLN